MSMNASATVKRKISMTVKKSYNPREKVQRELLDAVLQSLEEERIPWKRPWDDSMFIPINAVTGKPYAKANLFNLMMQANAKGYTDPRWCTLKQANSNNWRIKKGSKASTIFKTNIINKETGKIVNLEDLEKMSPEEIRDLQPKLKKYTKTYNVFNGSQIIGIPKLSKNDTLRFEYNESETQRVLDTLVKNMEVTSRTGPSAFYTAANDTVTLPPIDAFSSSKDYFATAIHELTHATGHKSRLNRDLSSSFGTPGYGREELIAELNSMLVGIDLGLIGNEVDVENHKAYCQSWYQALKDNPEALYDALNQAYLARTYMHEKGEIELTLPKKELEVNRDTLKASVLIKDYAENVLGFEVQASSGGLYQLAEHPSCKIYPNNSFHRFSREVGGDLFDFIMHFEEVNFVESYKRAEAFYNEFKPELKEGIERSAFKAAPRVLELPPQASNNDKVIEYLTQERGLSEALVKEFIQKGYLYQDLRNNAVFVGYDGAIPRYGMRRGTMSDFKGDVKGSQKNVGFMVWNDAETLVITEGVIDSMSLMEMLEDKDDYNYLSIGGVSNSLSCFNHFLENKERANKVKTIILAYDNDEAGIDARELLSAFIQERHPSYNVEILEPIEKDFNQDLVDVKNQKEDIENLQNTQEEFERYEREYQASLNGEHETLDIGVPESKESSIHEQSLDTDLMDLTEKHLAQRGDIEAVKTLEAEYDSVQRLLHSELDSRGNKLMKDLDNLSFEALQVLIQFNKAKIERADRVYQEGKGFVTTESDRLAEYERLVSSEVITEAKSFWINNIADYQEDNTKKISLDEASIVFNKYLIEGLGKHQDLETSKSLLRQDFKMLVESSYFDTIYQRQLELHPEYMQQEIQAEIVLDNSTPQYETFIQNLAEENLEHKRQTREYLSVHISERYLKKTFKNIEKNRAYNVMTFPRGSKYAGYTYVVPASFFVAHGFDEGTMTLSAREDYQFKVTKGKFENGTFVPSDEQTLSAHELISAYRELEYEPESRKFVRITQEHLNEFKELLKEEKNLEDGSLLQRVDATLHERDWVMVARQKMMQLQRAVTEENKEGIKMMIDAVQKDIDVRKAKEPSQKQDEPLMNINESIQKQQATELDFDMEDEMEMGM